jgi:protein O-mannosyl-transferase
MATLPKRFPLPLVLCLLLAGSVLAVYWPVRHHQFLNWDDLTYLDQNDHVRGGLTWTGVAWAFTHSYSSNWHPVTWLSHMLDCQLYGLQPAGHHLTNLLFHTANTLLLFLLLRRLTGALWRSAFVAALFALHPLHVESVAWAAERKDVLSAFFFLLTLLAYAKYVSRGSESKVQSPKSKVGGVAAEIEHATPNTQHVPRFRTSTLQRFNVLTLQRFNAPHWYFLALFLFALGLMSKPMLVTLPFVLVLLDFWPLRRFRLAGTNKPLSPGVQSSRFRVQGSRFALLPSAFSLQPSAFLEKLPFLALSAVSCVITVISQKRGGAVASFAMLPFGARVENAAVAYVEYLVKFFWPTALSPIYPHPKSWAFWQVGGAVAVLVLLTATAWRWRHRFPFLLAGWLWFLGTLVPVIGLVQVGSQAFADRYTYIPLIGIMVAVVWLVTESKVQSPRSKAQAPETAGRGEGEKSEGRGQGSEVPSKNSICVHLCSSVVCLAVLGVLSWRTSAQLAFWQDTATLFGRALALDPNNVQALYGLGSDLVDRGKVEEGKPLLEKAIRLQPEYPEALGTLANLFDGEGKYSDAIRFYEAALKAQPNQDGVLNNLAWLRASCPDAAFRNGAEAVPLAGRACDLTGYSKPLFIGTLAAAQAEAGDFKSAIATAQRAEALATSLRLDDIAARNRELIELYRQGKPARSSSDK